MNSSVFGSDSQPGLTLLATGRQDCSDLHSWGPGVRPVYIIHYILRGQGFIEYHKKTFPVHTGESFLIYPYDTIRYYPDPGNPWEYTWVEFTGKEAASLLDQTAFSPAAPVCPAICPARLRQLFADLQPLDDGHQADGNQEVVQDDLTAGRRRPAPPRWPRARPCRRCGGARGSQRD